MIGGSVEKEEPTLQAAIRERKKNSTH